MRLVTFEAHGHPRAALLRDGRVYDIWGDASRGARTTDRTMEAILEGGLLDEIEPLPRATTACRSRASRCCRRSRAPGRSSASA